MRKRKNYSLTILLLLLIAVFLLLLNRLSPVKITAEQLAKEYTENKSLANEKYLDSELIITGKVKAFYQIMETRKVLELYTGSEKNVFCFFLNSSDEFKAGQMQQEQTVTVKGICRGEDTYTFISGIKIDVEEIVEQ